MGLDTITFNACLDSGRKYYFVQRDVEEGGAAGVTGTPSMFINGRFLNGAQPYEKFQEIIEDLTLDKALYEVYGVEDDDIPFPIWRHVGQDLVGQLAVGIQNQRTGSTKPILEDEVGGQGALA